MKNWIIATLCAVLVVLGAVALVNTRSYVSPGKTVADAIDVGVTSLAIEKLSHAIEIGLQEVKK
jgi:hypothetical protein